MPHSYSIQTLLRRGLTSSTWKPDLQQPNRTHGSNRYTTHVQAFLRNTPILWNKRQPIGENKTGSQKHRMKYTQLVNWETPDFWIVKRPQTTAEEDKLIEAGFEYVRYDERNQCPLYKKRKWVKQSKNLTDLPRNLIFLNYLRTRCCNTVKVY